MRPLNRFRLFFYAVSSLISVGTVSFASATSYMVTDLGSLSSHVVGFQSVAFDINNARQIVGDSNVGFGAPIAITWSGSTVTALGPRDDVTQKLRESIKMQPNRKAQK